MLDNPLLVLPKGAFYRSAVGTLVEYSSRLVMLARLKKASAPADRRALSCAGRYAGGHAEGIAL